MSRNRLAANFALAFAALAGTALQSSLASADTFFDLTFTQVGTPGNGCCGPFNVSALLDTTGGPGQYTIVGISGTVFQGGPPGTAYSITGLLSPPSDPGGYFGFNNIVFNGAQYDFDSGGVGFTADGIYNFYATNPPYPPEPDTSFNVYDNGYPAAILSTTASYDVNTSFNGTYSITELGPQGSASATPLPAALPLFASGLGGLGLLGWRRKRKAAALAARLIKTRNRISEGPPRWRSFCM
jgi:hypothetical protein